MVGRTDRIVSVLMAFYASQKPTDSIVNGAAEKLKIR
jgi:hypothetical protein